MMIHSMIRPLSLALIAVTAVFAMAQNASAHSYHTPNSCATTAPEICAHVGFATQPNSTDEDETEFTLHFMPKGVDPKLVTNVAVELWMEMSGHVHRGAPVTVAQVDDVHFKVTNVQFMSMSGPWLVKATFDYNGTRHEVVIPIVVL